VRNIEIKARCAELARAREVARRLGAVSAGTQHQIDTYFCTSAGPDAGKIGSPSDRARLKLREGEKTELIWYRRPDESGPKASDYAVAPVAYAEQLRAVLSSALGTWVTVEKTRELWLLENVRIHLDEVRGLGSFLEFEAVVGADHSESLCLAGLRRLLEAFEITEQDLIAGSYSDLLARRGA